MTNGTLPKQGVGRGIWAPVEVWALPFVRLTAAVFHTGSAQAVKVLWLHLTDLQELPASPHMNPGR